MLAWPDVRKWQPPPDPNAPASSKVKRVTGSYNGYSPTSSYVGEHPATDLPQDDTLFWVEARKYEANGYASGSSASECKDPWLVLLPSHAGRQVQARLPEGPQRCASFVKARLDKQVEARGARRGQAVRRPHYAEPQTRSRTWRDEGGRPRPARGDPPRPGPRDKASTATRSATSTTLGGPPKADTTVLSVCHRRYPLLVSRVLERET